MQNGSEQPGSEEAPLYVRWNPDRSPYAIELRLDLVARMSEELARAEKLGIEVGGVLIGSFPNAYTPTLRIEDAEIVPRGPEEGATYVVDPSQQHDRFVDIRWRAKARERDAVGFFRSHLRPGLMRPSLADRSLLSAEFRDSLYAVLLIDGREPHMAGFFLVTAHGQLAGEPSVRNFRFNESEFRALPEVQPGSATPQVREATQRREGRSRARVYATVAALVAIAVAGCILMWSFSRQTALPRLLESSNPLKLSITDRDHLLRISWDHGARQLERALGATVVIADGTSRREIQLGLDELRLGAVEYERSSDQVEVTMVVDTAGSASPNETVDWTPRRSVNAH